MTTKWVGASDKNYTVGREGKQIKYIVMHWMVGTLESCDATFANPERKASAHYGIGDNDVHQYVKEDDTAWHAGNWTINQVSIGIEHEGGWLLEDGTRFKPSDKTHETSGKLVADICRRYNLPISRDTVKTHLAYRATQCPGTLDIDRIIEIAKNYAQPPVDPTKPVEVIDNPQQKLDLDEPWGIMELQATISTLNDQKRDLDNWEKQCENAVNKAIAENNTDWQSKLDTANGTIEQLEQTISKIEDKQLSEYHWKVLMSQAWKNWWVERKGGEK